MKNFRFDIYEHGISELSMLKTATALVIAMSFWYGYYRWCKFFDKTDAERS